MRSTAVFLLVVISMVASRAAGGDHASSAVRALSGPERQQRLSIIRDSMDQTLRALEKRLASANAQPTTRDLTNGALAALLLGRESGEAEKMLEMAFADQDLDTGSKGYGLILWQIGHPEIHDENAIDFASQAVGPILLSYAQVLSPTFRARFDPHVRASVVAMTRRKLSVSYTNIWLMRAVNLILIGEATSDQTTSDLGYHQLDDWIAHTRQAGIHEFDSPVYYFVDLDSLGAGYAHAQRREGRAKLKTILDYFWTDIAANFFPADGVLAGPASRNYSFLSSAEGIDLYLYAEGLRATDDMPHPDLQKIFLLDSAGPRGYHPAAERLALAALPERVVRSRWDAPPDHDRYQYLTGPCAIGGASGSYGPQDKLITVELASGGKLPVIAIVPDVTDSPYGTRKTLDRSGHPKPAHLALNPVCVQEKGALLALLDIDPSLAPDTADFATNVLLPIDADRIVIGGEAIGFDDLFEKPLALNTTVGLRHGDAGVAFRIFHVDGAAGAPGQIVMKLDAEGLNHRAARLAAFHYRGQVRHLTDQHVRFGIVILARTCKDAGAFDALVRDLAAAKIDDRDAGNSWSVAATLGSLTLEASRSLIDRSAQARKVNGSPISFPILSINDQPVDLAP